VVLMFPACLSHGSPCVKRMLNSEFFREIGDDCQQSFDNDSMGMDGCFMSAALSLAQGVQKRTWPNPPVGAVVVKDGVIVGRGAHLGPGQPHAEPVALKDAGDNARGGTLYVTLEPCNHTGRTAPCTQAVLESGVARVVVGIRDPNPTVAGGGARYLRERGLEVEIGVLPESCLELIWPFAATDNFTRVYVELKTATSLDGRFAPGPELRQTGEPFYLTGEAARIDVHRRRRRVDLVLVGEGTVAADRPRLDGRLAAGDHDVPQVDPLPGYVDTDLSWQGGFARDHYLVFAGESVRHGKTRLAVEKDGGEILFCREKNGHLDPKSLLEVAATRDMLTVMVEGGPRLAGSLLFAGLVDRWVNYMAPVVLGRGVTWPNDFAGPNLPDRSFSLTRLDQLEKDLLFIHDRKNFSATLARVTL
jgi:diaminohydroxyphosphoribosylaminopyrimidine deaminase / 5-amino-6-(5-phosphoribosylamino)uracil reductase